MPSKRFEYNYALRGSAWKVEDFFFCWGKHRLFGLDRIMLQNQNCFSVPGEQICQLRGLERPFSDPKYLFFVFLDEER